MAAMGDEALIGRVLDGRYVIGQRIARGGMASVFMATDKRLDRVVAVKVMHSGLGDDRQFTERFVREARSAAKLNHSNVVAVFDQGSDGEITYLVMEYVPGNTLRDIMREECPMPPRRALALIEQILIALSAAHAASIIHRDIKPENVLITPAGAIKVADFGLARAVSAATTATGGTLIGTVSYLAPEIVVNDGADARSDIYACGALLYEMLTGLKPHAGESPIQVAYKHVHEDIAAPSAAVPGIPPYLDALVARTTARDRDQRSTDARVMLQQVRQVIRAIDAGIADDPELTQELRPRASGAPSVGANETTDPFPVFPPPQAAADEVRTAAVSSDGGLIFHDTDATLQWKSGPVAPPTTPAGIHPAMTPARYKEIKAGQPRRRRGKYVLIGVIILALLAALGGWYYGIGRYVETPPLVNSSEAQAIATAKSEGFTLKVSERKFSEKFALGLVMSTDPKPGAKILPKSTIHAVVSKGKERYPVPNLKGKTIAEATAVLASDTMRLTLGSRTEKFDEKVPAGEIVGTKLKTGTLLKRNEPVDVYVSKGREPIDVTNYTGKTQAEATKALEDAGFKVSVELAYDNAVMKGTVISQAPHDGTKFKNDTITLTVSKGQAPIDVPNVVGQRANQAEKILTEAGFKVDHGLHLGNSRVVSQSPSGQAVPGSTIKLNYFSF